MNKQILEIIKSIKGSLLGIGLNDSELLDAIENNDNIHTCYILSSTSLTSKKFNMSKRGKNKKINIKKIKKHFKKKSLDTVICNYETIKQFQKSFVPNSVYLNKGILYIYGEDEEINNLKLKYERYTNDIEITKYKNQVIMKVNNKNTKNNFFKDNGYKIKDFFSETIEIITDILIN